MYKWDIYEITSDSIQLHGVKLRGRIRKFSIDKRFNILVENASDKENTVRFAVESGKNPDNIIAFINTLAQNLKITLIQSDLVNPVLSKMKVNIEDRYSL